MPGERRMSLPDELQTIYSQRPHTVDAACASSMVAVQTAIKGLQDHDYMAVTGGADRSMEFHLVKLCKDRSTVCDAPAPFDKSANGFDMGGCGILIPSV